MNLHYFLKNLLLPPCTQLLLLLLAWSIRKKATCLAWGICILSVSSLWIVSTPITATYLARTLETAQPLPPELLGELQVDAIVILSSTQNEFSPEFNHPVSGKEQLMRVRYGAYLQRETGLPVLLSGVSSWG